jgi:5-(carboxyamino)imidazole ribonucleotide mutase
LLVIIAEQLIPITAINQQGSRLPLRREAAAPGLRHAHGGNEIIGSMNASPAVGVVMGSKSDYEVLLPCIELLQEFAIPYEARIVSAHRTPDWLFQYAEQAEPRGLKIIIAAAGGAAHLPGMIAAKTILPVLAVPVPATCLNGIDSLLSIVQMPKGVPVATLAIGKPGAANAALLAVAILAINNLELGNRLRGWRQARSREVLEAELPG